MCKYDEMQKCVVVPALGNVPLQWVSRAMFVNLDEKPLNVFSVPASVCGHAVAPGRTGTWTLTSVFNTEAVLFTQVIARGDSLTTSGQCRGAWHR